ncbi:MAG: hypothetical protein ACU85E_11265 [Gammaproteobacteria bacterium]
MNRPWFDPETGVLILDEYVSQMPSFKKIMADNLITDTELAEHAANVTDKLKQLDAALPPDIKELATDALCELAVLYTIMRLQGR